MKNISFTSLAINEKEEEQLALGRLHYLINKNKTKCNFTKFVFFQNWFMIIVLIFLIIDCCDLDGVEISYTESPRFYYYLSSFIFWVIALLVQGILFYHYFTRIESDQFNKQYYGTEIEICEYELARYLMNNQLKKTRQMHLDDVYKIISIIGKKIKKNRYYYKIIDVNLLVCKQNQNVFSIVFAIIQLWILIFRAFRFICVLGEAGVITMIFGIVVGCCVTSFFIIGENLCSYYS